MNPNETIEQVRKSIVAFLPAFEQWCDAAYAIVSKALPRLEGAMAPYTLMQKDKRGRNIVKGKARRRLKLLASQVRRGII